jgi:hypothetical protein
MSQLILSVFAESRFGVLRTLVACKKPCGVREIADRVGLSPRGAKVVLEVLVRERLAKKEKGKYLSKLSSEDEHLMNMLISIEAKDRQEKRVKELSRKASKVLNWIPGTLQKLKKAKQKYESTRTSSKIN